MNIWYCIPSKRVADEAQNCITAWRTCGYRTAVWRDAGDEHVDADLILSAEYGGYAQATNALISEACERGADICIIGGDDVYPDPSHDPQQVGAEFVMHFNGTFGVMQPTGDRWGEDRSQPNFCGSAYVDRVCCSAWLGREFCQTTYGGNGPLYHGYHHMFVDEELQEVAIKLGVLWQRRDLTQYHRHWGRTGRTMPGFLAVANSAHHWQRYANLFAMRKAAGFPGHEVADVTVEFTA